MRGHAAKLISWLAGVAGVIAIVYFYRPENLDSMLRAVGVQGFVILAALTLLARWIQTETTVIPLRAMGHDLRRSDAFWIGWLRTFANQIVPSSGVAAYAQALRRRTSISWSELAALAAPQFVLVAAALGLVGLIAVLCNIGALGNAYPTLLAIYALVLVVSVTVTHGAPGFIRIFPARMAERLERTSAALRSFSSDPVMVVRIIASHAMALLLRGGRIWLLFTQAGAELGWAEALIVVAIAESSMLIQLTPGGLGIREGAVVAGASLVGIPTGVAAAVAVVDRLLVLAVTTLLTPPAILALRRAREAA